MESKVHYKMYKMGKHWVISGIAVAGVLLAGASAAKADTTTDSNTPASTSQASAQPVAESEASAQPAAESQASVQPVAESQASAQPAAESEASAQPAAESQASVQPVAESQTSAQPAAESQASAQPAAESEASAPAAAESQASAQPVAESEASVQPAAESQASAQPVAESQASAQPVAESEASAPAKANQQKQGNQPVLKAAPQVRQLADVQAPTPKDGHVVLDKDNFKDYFELGGDENGTAVYQDGGTLGTIQLTEDKKSLTGNAIIRGAKMDLSKDFNISGQVYLGAHQGADGISMYFQPGPTLQKGAAGEQMGIGGITNAFGFKLDTFFNSGVDVQPIDPTTNKPVSAPFGGFQSVDSNGKYQTFDGKDEPGAQVQWISQPSNVWNDFTVAYSATNKTMTVTYVDSAQGKTLTWTKDLTQWLADAGTALSFGFSAATGGLTNNQQIRFDNFDFYAIGTVTYKFVDTEGNSLVGDKIFQDTIPLGQNHPEGTAVSDQKQALVNQGWQLKEVTAEDPANFDANDNSVTSTSLGNTVTYVFEHAITPITPATPQTPGDPINPANPDGPKWPAGTDKNAVQKTSTRTIKYQDEDGNPVAPDKVQTVTYANYPFVDNVTGQIIGYDADGDGVYDAAKDIPAPTDGTTPAAAWIPDTDSNGKYAEVPSPILDDLTPDQTTIAEVSVQPGDENKLVVVTYIPDEAPAGGESEPTEPGNGDTPNVTPGQEDSKPTPAKPAVPSKTVTPAKPAVPSKTVTPSNTPQAVVQVDTSTPQPQAPTTKTATGQQVVLPKTDQTNSRIGTLAGIIGVLLTGLGFIGINKKKHD